jgi:RES domain-containing protein
MINPARQRAVFSGEGARLHGGRWNMKGWPALYLAADQVTAVAEYYQGLPRPGMLVPYRIAGQAIADLTDGRGGPADDRVAQALAAAWKTVAAIDGQVPPSWTLAQELIAAGAQGALVPSAQNRAGTAIVLWRWREAHGAGDGAVLTLLDPERSLTSVG